MRPDRSDGNGVLVAAILGFATMLTLGIVHAELDLGRPLGFWPSLGLALPIVCVVTRLRARGKDFADAMLGNVMIFGWAVMICAGVLHHEFEAGIALGFWPSAGVVLPVAALVAGAQEDPAKKAAYPANLILGTVLLAWTLMISAGVAHHELGVGRPVGYWPCAGVALGVMALVGLLVPAAGPAPRASAISTSS